MKRKHASTIVDEEPDLSQIVDMVEVRTTQEFLDWTEGLKDRQGRAAILRRVSRLSEGAFGDVKPVGKGLSELRIHVGPGYRIYVAQRGRALIVVLCGGDKSSQAADIKRAKELAGKLE